MQDNSILPFLPRIPVKRVLITNHLAPYLGGLSFPLGRLALQIALADDLCGQPLCDDMILREEESLYFSVKLPRGRMVLSVPLSWSASIAPREIPVFATQNTQISQTITAQIADLLADKVAQILSHWLGRSISVVSGVKDELEVYQSFILSPDPSSLLPDGFAFVDYEGLRWCSLAASAKLALATNTIDLGAIPIPILVDCGHAMLTIHDLMNAKSGDIILLADGISEGGPPAWLELPGDRRAAAAIDKGKVILLSDVLKEGNARVSQEEDANLGDLPVEVSFEIARTTLPLAEVSVLAEGSIVPLDQSGEKAPRVHIRINGMRVGAGEIVKIGERVGIKILSLRQNSSGPQSLLEQGSVVIEEVRNETPAPEKKTRKTTKKTVNKDEETVEQ